jgi:uncharacterized repeat protein (TIGR01451 family)
VKRIFLLLALLCTSALSFAQGTITNGAASFVRNVSGFDVSPSANFTGVTSTAASDQLFEFGWWYRVSGDTAETPFPTPTTQNYTGDTSTLVWTDVNGRGFNAREVCVVVGIASPVGGKVVCTMTITNPGASPLAIDLFVFADIDLGGSASGDNATLGIATQRIDLTEAAGTNTAQFAGVGANALLVRPFAAATDVAGLLSDALVTNFDNSGLPATNIDFTGGFQWTATIPAGGSRDFVSVVAVNTTALISADLSITKTDGVTTATPGGSVTYTITASNAGPDAAAATVADTFPASLTCTWTCVGAGGGTCTASGSGNINDTVNLPAGASTTYTASCTISASATGTLSNTATVTATTAGLTDPTPGNNSATDTDTLVASADLGITVTDGVTSATAGGSVTYTITASNAGPSNVTGATISDTFPASLTCTWTCAGAGGGTCTASGSGNIADTANLPSGGSVIYTASCAVSASATGSLVNTATVSSGTTDPNPGNNSATDTDALGASADLAVTITDTPDPVTAGAQITYTINASNAGPSNAATVAMSVSVPANTTFVSLTAPGGWACTTPAVGGTGVVNCSLASLANAASASFTLVVAVAPAFSGSISATASLTTATTDPVPGNNSQTTTTAVNALTFPVTAVASGGGGTITCASPVVSGSTTTCTLTPNAGYRIASVSGCGGVPGSTSPYTTGVITAACTVTAVFVLEVPRVVPTIGFGAIVLLTFALGVLGMRRRHQR